MEYKERRSNHIFWLVIIPLFIVAILNLKIHNQHLKEDLRTEEEQFQTYLDEYGDTITVYIEDTTVEDYRKLDLSKYYVSFSQDHTKMYLEPSLKGHVYHSLNNIKE